ncbi:MAG: outer membrane protein [Pseudomonadota bacterium]|jgi:FKBP-type peptidyl-prolyl cis-trans isomerase
MKLKYLSLVVMMIVSAVVNAEEAAVVNAEAAAKTEKESIFKSEKDKVSYGIGAEVGRNFRKQEVEVNQELLLKGLNDALTGSKMLIPEKELRKVMNTFQNSVRMKTMMNKRVATEENRKKGEAYQAANKAKDGVVTLPSGVQYKIVKAGNGPKPTEASTILCNYRGTLIDGSEFDATDTEPATLKIASLIPGWKQALQLMPVGAKWQIVVPPNLAYGERGVGADIGPSETLLFDVELVAIK